MLDLALGFALTGYASYTDWKTTEVPDWLTYGGIGLGLVGRLTYSVFTSDWSFLTAGLLGFGLMFLIGCFLYYTAQWGGGDAKLLMALGATLGIAPSMDHNFISFLVNLLVLGGVYGLLYTLALAFKEHKKVRKALTKHFSSNESAKAKLASYTGCAGFLLLGFFTPALAKPLFFALAFVMISGFYLWGFTKAVEEAAMVKKVYPKDLLEGDWILDTIIHKGKEICSPKDLGVTLKQIATLKRLRKQGKVKKITMKQGIPFCPAFFLAYVAMLIGGNLVVLLGNSL
ncbi:MAG: prepilin peptidase [Candidatus Nanoarchaeia archaeon]